MSAMLTHVANFIRPAWRPLALVGIAMHAHDVLAFGLARHAYGETHSVKVVT